MLKSLLTASALLVSSQVFAADPVETATDLVQSFESIFGTNNGKRRNHTKGFCFAGRLTPEDADIQQYSASDLFLNEAQVVGRLSHKGGKLTPADDKLADYGLSLAIESSTGEKTMMSMNTEDFFPVSTPEAFADLMRAKATGADSVKAFVAGNEDFQRYKAHMSARQRQLASYESQTYNSVNSFYLVDGSENRTAVRWAFVPGQEAELLIEPSENFFYENLQARLEQSTISFDMKISFAAENDDVNNAALPWSDENKSITAAVLHIDSISREAEGDCDRLNYDPMVLSTGMEASDDPILQARRNVYALTFGKRLNGQ